MIIFVLFICIGFSTSEVIRCGRPGRPSNGTVSPLGNTYFPGEKVTYKCIPGFVIFGQETVTCLKNGTWSAQTPVCDLNLAKGKQSLQSDTLWSYSPELAVDGNPDTCSFTPRGPEPRWWQVHLVNKMNIVHVAITISPGSFQEFTIYVIELLEDNKALYKPCTTFKGVFQTHKGMFKCNDGVGHFGQFVYVRDDRKEEEYFGLCEVEVFAPRERVSCGDPEIPVNGRVVRNGEDKISFFCEVGFQLEGHPTITCSSKGSWNANAPTCKVIKCNPPPHIENGYIEIGNPKGEYVYGTEAKYGCSPGHHLDGIRIRTCSQTGTWSGDEPTCKPISCGTPPTFPNSRYTVINSTDQWTRIVIYSCQSGYYLQYSDDETVTTCLDSGEWRHINITCVSSLVTNALSREGKGINYEIFEGDDPKNTPTLVIALAVIAGVLATSITIFIFIFIRKKFSSDRPDDRIDKQDNRIDKPVHKYSFSSPFIHNSVDQKDPQNDEGFTNPYDGMTEVDHNYETLGKNSKVKHLIETASLPGYEVVKDGKAGTEPGYETLDKQNLENDYETLKDKNAGYETLKRSQDPGYEIVGDFSTIQHGYETIKPKLPPPNNTIEKVPDILQNLMEANSGHAQESNFSPAQETNSGSAQEYNEIPAQESNEIPLQILALYAKVDKSKKKKNQDRQKEPQNTKELIKRFNSLSSDDNQSDSLSSDNSIRPLPPLPK